MYRFLIPGEIQRKNRVWYNATGTEAEMMLKKVIVLMDIKGLLSKVVVKPAARLTEAGIEASVSITNISDRPIELRYSSGQKYDFILYDSSYNQLYRWSEGKFFTMALESIQINPGESITFKENIDRSKVGEDVISKAAILKVIIPAILNGEEDLRNKTFEVKIPR